MPVLPHTRCASSCKELSCSLSFLIFKMDDQWTSLVAQVLKLCASHCRGHGFNPWVPGPESCACHAGVHPPPPKGTRLSSLSTQRRGGAAKCLHASYRHKSKACHYLCKVVKFWPNSHLKSSQSILALDQQEKNFFQMTEICICRHNALRV